MKIITYGVMEWNENTQKYEVVEEISHEYQGPVAKCLGGGGSTTVKASEPWDEAKPYYENLYREAQRAYNTQDMEFYPGQTVAEQSPYTLAAQQMALDYLTGMGDQGTGTPFIPNIAPVQPPGGQVQPTGYQAQPQAVAPSNLENIHTQAAGAYKAANDAYQAYLNKQQSIETFNQPEQQPVVDQLYNEAVRQAQYVIDSGFAEPGATIESVIQQSPTRSTADYWYSNPITTLNPSYVPQGQQTQQVSKIGALDSFTNEIGIGPLSQLKQKEVAGELTFDQLKQVYNKANELGLTEQELLDSTGYDKGIIDQFVQQQGLTPLKAVSDEKYGQLDSYVQSLGIGSLADLKAKEVAGELTFDQLKQVYSKAGELGFTENELLGATGYDKNIMDQFVQQQGMTPLPTQMPTQTGMTQYQTGGYQQPGVTDKYQQLDAFTQSLGVGSLADLKAKEMSGELSFDQLKQIYNRARDFGFTEQEMLNATGYDKNIMDQFVQQQGLEPLPTGPSTSSVPGMIQSMMKQTGDVLAGEHLDPNYGAGQSEMEAILAGRGTGYGAGDEMAQKILTGEMLSPDTNPYLQENVKYALKDIGDVFSEQFMPQLRNEFVGSGTFGGSRQAIAENLGLESHLDQASKVAAGMYGDAYETERDRQQQLMGLQREGDISDQQQQLSALGDYAGRYSSELDRIGATGEGLGTTIETGMIPTEAVGAIGEQQEAYQQQILNDLIGRWDWEQQAPWAGLQNLSAILQGGSFKNLDSTSATQPNRLAQLAGLGMTAGGLYDTFDS